MEKLLEIPPYKTSLLEKFGIYYLGIFTKNEVNIDVFTHTDEELRKKINSISLWGILLSSFIGILCVFPTVWIDVKFQDAPPLTHYGWVAIITLLSIIIELYLLFLIALKAVDKVSELINIHATKHELLSVGPFNVKHILARTALEIPDPELKIMGIDPFKQISKKNLFILSLLYKAKIFFTNIALKYTLIFLVGKYLFGISILYEALFVEAFWNSIVIIRVIHEARFRLFGFALANKIGEDVIKEKLIQSLSEKAKIGCLRAIGNAVVMAQNYHPNMIILLIQFQKIIKLKYTNNLDNWDLLLETIQTVSEKEKYFLLDLFTVSAAFDGKISALELKNLKNIYQENYEVYLPRLIELTNSLKDGRINKALSLCKLDFVVG